MTKTMILAASAVLGLAAGPVFAADLPQVPASIVEQRAPAFNWTGFYVGGQIGYQFGDDRTRDFNPAGALTPLNGGLSPDGLVGGLHLGYNQQFGQFLAGLEGDIEGGDVSGGFRQIDGSGVSTRLDWQGSIRARLGVVYDRLLIYGTGGVAFGDIRHRYLNAGAGISQSFNDVQTGWTVGAGAEYAIAPNWTTRLEYRYTDYGSFNNGALGNVPTAYRQEPSFQTIRLGVSYKF